MSLLVESLLYLGVMLILAKLAEEAFGRLNLVRFVGPIIVGIVLGNGVTDFVKINVIISFITSLGIVFLLFLAGAEELGERLTIGKNEFASSIFQLSLPFFVIAMSLFYLGQFSFLLVIPLSMTSVGPLTRLLIDLGISKQKTGITIFNQSVFNEIIAVILFAIFTKFKPISIISIVVLVILIFLLGSQMARLLELIEGYIKVREIEFATIISTIFLIGFVAEILNFNSAIAALFLGFLLRDYLKDRPYLVERLRAFTYGFFEPLFFVGIGLYFVKISLQLLIISLMLFGLVSITKFLSGFITARIVNINPIINGLGTSIKGGVDASLLLSALTTGLISPYQYSFSVLAIVFATLLFPLLFRLKFGKPKVEEKKINLQQPVIRVIQNTNAVHCYDTLRKAIDLINDKGYRAVVIVDDQMHPLGYISVSQLLEISPSEYERMRVCEMEKNELRLLEKDSKIIDVLRVFRETEDPVVALIDDEGVLVSVVYERELLRCLNPVNEEKK